MQFLPVQGGRTLTAPPMGLSMTFLCLLEKNCRRFGLTAAPCGAQPPGLFILVPACSPPLHPDVMAIPPTAASLSSLI